jgi:hypothetical protein
MWYWPTRIVGVVKAWNPCARGTVLYGVPVAALFLQLVPTLHFWPFEEPVAWQYRFQPTDEKGRPSLLHDHAFRSGDRVRLELRTP